MNNLALARIVSAVLMAAAGSTRAAAILDIKMTAVPIYPYVGLYDVVVSAKATGSSTGQGDGGISDAQFAITSVFAGHTNVVAAGSGPLTSKAKITWDPAVTSNFSTVNPSRTDLGSDGDYDLNGAAFFDSNNFTKTDLGVDGYQILFTTQFQVSPAYPEILHLTVSNAQYYDFTNGTAPNFRGTFSQITTHDWNTFPEPTSLGLIGLCTMTLASRRRRRA